MSQALEANQSTHDDRGADLADRWADLRREQPQLRIRDAAQRLGVSEAELVAAGCGATATRLSGDWQRLLGELQRLGPLMALTRNAHAVHEKTGRYSALTGNGAIGTMLGEIDLRVFFSRWQHGFAVREESSHGVRDSLQFFDQSGTAVHKVYLTPQSDRDAYLALVAAYRAHDQGTLQAVSPPPPALAPLEDAQIDLAGLQAHWRALQDMHDFTDLLARFGCGRVQAFRLVEDDLAAAVSRDAPRLLLEHVAERGMDIMLLVSSPGVVQIHTGPVRNLRATGPWFNVLDEVFNLHLRETAIDSAWVVCKPTRDGVVSSLELFGGDGGLICQIFGRRKPGQAEDPAWRAALDVLAWEASA